MLDLPPEEFLGDPHKGIQGFTGRSSRAEDLLFFRNRAAGPLAAVPPWESMCALEERVREFGGVPGIACPRGGDRRHKALCALTRLVDVRVSGPQARPPSS